MNRIRGLDAIRFVCALWVVLGHYNVPLPYGSDGGSSLARAVDSFLHSVFYGPPAVIIFFVISGFCIHYPFRRGEMPDWREYYARRYVRIGVPLLAAAGIIFLMGPRLTQLEQSVMWSLYAEIIYYTIYPLLRFARFRFGWPALLAVSAVGVVAVVLHDPTAKAFNVYGPAVTWILGLPCWLLGCLLAERSDVLTAAPVRGIALWRVGIWVMACVCGVLRFHSPVSYIYTLDPFGILVFFWLQQEIRHNRWKAPFGPLERAGAWSYSLYLMHHPAHWAYDRLTALSGLHLPGRALSWVLQIAFALAFSYLFFRLVESPSHWLARQFKRGRRGPDAPAPGEKAPRPAAPEAEPAVLSAARGESS